MTRHFWAVQYRRFRETDRRVEPLMVVLDTRPPPAASSAICATPVRSFLINTPLDTLFRCVRETPDTLRLTNMEDHGSATVQHGLVFQLRPCGFRHVHFHLHGHVYPFFAHVLTNQSMPREARAALVPGGLVWSCHPRCRPRPVVYPASQATKDRLRHRGGVRDVRHLWIQGAPVDSCGDG